MGQYRPFYDAEDRGGGTSSFIENGFSSNDGHDNAEYEKEAEVAAGNFKGFNKFVNEKIGKNAIADLLSEGLSEEKKI